MIQGFMDGQAILMRLGQLVDIAQNLGFQVSELKIQLAATAQFAGEQQQAPPKQKSGVIDDHRFKAGIGQGIGPIVKFGPEMALGSDKGLAQL